MLPKTTHTFSDPIARAAAIQNANDPALSLWTDWHRARHVSLVLCRVQQRLETRMMVNPGIPVLTDGEKKTRRTSVAASEEGSEYAVVREAEVFAMTEALRLQDAIPNVAAQSLVGIVAKLEMIVGADRDIGDPTDFPWPHIASVLRDLKAIAGDLPAYRLNRAATRADVARHRKEATKLVAALEAHGLTAQVPISAAINANTENSDPILKCS